LAHIRYNKPRVIVMTSAGTSKRIIWVQLPWALSAAAWNIAGVALIANGARSPGPTASLLGAALLTAIGVGLVAASNRAAIIYAGLSIVSAAMAGAAVYNALTADPSLWPSEYWRYAGIVLNGIGTIAGSAALMNLLNARAV
jgi:hypothetical protein